MIHPIPLFLGRGSGRGTTTGGVGATGIGSGRVDLKDLTKLVKSLSTFCAVFADVSRNSQPNWLAIACPSSLVTWRSRPLSHLFPTRIKIGLLRFTRSISCLKTSKRSNEARAVIEYTSMNPCPSLWNFRRSVRRNLKEKLVNSIWASV